jgi:hypothetical protein
MSDATLSFDVVERRNGFHFRFPADDETALWRGPYPTRAAAEAEAIEQIEAFIAAGVLTDLGLK